MTLSHPSPQQIKDRLAELPPTLAGAITSSDLEKHLRVLARKHKLMLDQWSVLQERVVNTILGFEEAEDLEQNIAAALSLSTEAAGALAEDISVEVFVPIREGLEELLGDGGGENDDSLADHDFSVPAPVDEPLKEAPVPTEIYVPPSGNPLPLPNQTPTPGQISNIPTTPAPTSPQLPLNPAIIPAQTNPTPQGDGITKALRSTISDGYHAGVLSHERKDVVGDPYRETP
jgi:hypothetical protein